MNVVEITERQRFAIEHPNDNSRGLVRPHPGCAKKQGKWTTILTVTRDRASSWIWMASVSRERAPGSTYKLKQWKPQWRDEGRAILEDILAGVGGSEVDYVETLRHWEVDAEEMRGLYLTRRLTPDELVLMRAGEQV